MSNVSEWSAVVGVVKDGEIVLPPGVTWPDGTVVRLSIINEEGELQNLRELLKDFEGMADDLPADMAENHNHYIHGHPKK